MVDMLKKIGIKIQNSPKPQAVTDTEKIGAELHSAEEAVRSFSGEYHLHYSRTSGGVNWKAIAEVIGQGPMPSNQMPVPNETMHKAGRILGLLPSCPESAPGPTSYLFPGKTMPPSAPRSGAQPFVISPAVAAAAAAPEAGVLDAVRRKRWRAERDTALGISHEIQLPETAAGVWQRDTITAAPLPKRAGVTHEDMETKFGASVLPTTGVSGHAVSMLASCTSVCGVSGGRWKRLKSGDP